MRAAVGCRHECALALISLGSTELWMARFAEAERHLADGVALAGRIGRPYLKFTGLAYQAAIEYFRSFALAAERSRQAGFPGLTPGSVRWRRWAAPVPGLLRPGPRG